MARTRYDEQAEYKEVLLKNLLYAFRRRIDEEHLNMTDLDVQLLADKAARELICQIRYKMATQEHVAPIRKQVTGVPTQRLVINTSRPCSVWQLIKEKYMPSWYITRWPVKYETVSTEQFRKVVVDCDVEVELDLVYPKTVIPEDRYIARFILRDKVHFDPRRQPININSDGEVVDAVVDN